MKKPSLSVVIPVKDMQELIPKTLQALANQDPVVDMEVIVVDDGSTDATAEQVRRLDESWIKLISQSNKGPAAARNRGIREAKADIIAFMDADVVPAPDWARSIIGPFESDPDMAGVEGRTICPDFDAVDPYSHFMRNIDGGGYQTCNIAYRRQWLERVGGFDEGYRLPWREDSGLAFSIIDAGGEIKFVPEAVVEHPVFPGSIRRVCITYSLRRQYDVLLKKRHPRLYRENIGPLTDKTELSFAISFILALLFFALGPTTAGWILLLAHQVVYGQVIQRKLMHKPNLHGQDYLKAYICFWPSTFLALYALVKGAVLYRDIDSRAQKNLSRITGKYINAA